MEQPLTWLDWVYVGVGTGLLFVGLVFWSILGHLPIKPKRSKFDWQPDLELPADVHVLGSEYPQRDGAFLRYLVKRTYTVPKDPEEYAKIFVPTKDRKGSAE
ncbi:MAG: hypothetical protein JWS10_4077 [Cypionkella sp.]|uniref:hypothetical protein n=1 Tax=Cypionkella sp. TaxID=2811411 RepID=UPI0026255931|nr:hypothetical protein [Cypionkella sp.]MDB5661462.1 hypothetical protein [Cypionkella sp.]